MKDSLTFAEADLPLVHALQIAPRAPWALVGRVLGISAITAARRWQRLADEGLAWVGAYPSPTLWAARHCLAFVEVDCEPGRRPAVVRALAADPRVISVEQVSGGRDLFLTVIVPGLGALSSLVLDELNPLAGVRRTRAHIVTRAYSEAKQWRLDALGPVQRAALAAETPPPSGAAGLGPGDRELLRALSVDGRRPAAELGQLTGTSQSTMRRRLGRLVRDGLVSLRCEVAQLLTGWPVLATFWARVPAQALDRTARALVTLPEIRMCMAVTGTANLILSVWLRSTGDTQRLEVQLARHLAELELIDRAITLKTDKRIGALLDEAGRRTGAVPIDPWGHPGDRGAAATAARADAPSPPV